MSVCRNWMVRGIVAAAVVALALVTPGTAHAGVSADGASRAATKYAIDGVVIHRYDPPTRFNPGFKDAFGKIDFQMQTDGNMVVYSTGPGSHALWASDTAGNPGAYLDMQIDGNLVIYKPNRAVLWASNTAGCKPSFFATQEDGNIVIYQKIGGANLKVCWSPNTAY